MSDDDNGGQMIFGDLRGLKLPDICLTGEEKPRENLTQETCPDRGSNPDPLRDRHACYRLSHSGGQEVKVYHHHHHHHRHRVLDLVDPLWFHVSVLLVFPNLFTLLVHRKELSIYRYPFFGHIISTEVYIDEHNQL